MKTVIVTDKPQDWDFVKPVVELVSAMDYVMDKDKFFSKKMRILNLCESYQYQKIGYYVSLLAQARNQKVIPSILTMQDMSNQRLCCNLLKSIDGTIQKALSKVEDNNFTLSIYFGKNKDQNFEKLAKKLHAIFPIPLFKVQFVKKKKWEIKNIASQSIRQIPFSHRNFLEKTVKDYFSHGKGPVFTKKPIFYQMAILHDPSDPLPPSNQKALENFINIGEQMHINVSIIGKDAYNTLPQYDALFIRETTSVNHHTYRFARKAATEGLVVMDDAHSILRCSNKVYLAELLNQHGVQTPKTWILGKKNWKAQLTELQFPCVLKKPDSAFSQGVVKVESKSDFKSYVEQFFKGTELLIAQSFMPTEYDWRVGVLDNKPLFACQYFMAKNHWQIFNWQAKDAKEKEEKEGGILAVPLSRVPACVMDAALKSTQLIGNSLYGVDIKQCGNEAIVIEVNDNPNIDAGIEDHILGDEIYEKIHDVFIKRISATRAF